MDLRNGELPYRFGLWICGMTSYLIDSAYGFENLFDVVGLTKNVSASTAMFSTARNLAASIGFASQLRNVEL